MIKKLFVEHPESVNETYCTHLVVALGFSFKLLIASIVCFVHAFVPGLFVKTGSGMMHDLHTKMVHSRVKKKQTNSKSQPAIMDYMI